MSRISHIKPHPQAVLAIRRSPFIFGLLGALPILLCGSRQISATLAGEQWQRTSSEVSHERASMMTWRTISGQQSAKSIRELLVSHGIAPPSVGATVSIYARASSVEPKHSRIVVDDVPLSLR